MGAVKRWWQAEIETVEYEYWSHRIDRRLAAQKLDNLNVPLDTIVETLNAIDLTLEHHDHA